eukprot:scaffold105450_cov21-Tisochrysis_lutea.AAC.1
MKTACEGKMLTPGWRPAVSHQGRPEEKRSGRDEDVCENARQVLLPGKGLHGDDLVSAWSGACFPSLFEPSPCWC